MAKGLGGEQLFNPIAMVGITSVEMQESLDELAQLLRQADTPVAKERLQVFYWLK